MMITQMKYEAHRFCEIFPESSAEEKRGVQESIRKIGLLHPVVLFEDQILDGRTREGECRKLGIEPQYVQFLDLGKDIVESGPLEYVKAQNLNRRHLTTSQKAMAAAKLVEEMKDSQIINGSKDPKTPKGTPGRPATGDKIEAAAKALGVSKPSVKRARKILKESPEKAEKIMAGAMTVGAAVGETKAADKRKSERLDAIQRVQNVCGKPLADAAERGSRLKTHKELMEFTAQDDDQMKAQAGLIELGCWSLKEAKLYRAKKLTLDRKLRDLANQAMANQATTSGFTLTVEIEGWRFTVSRTKNAA